MGCGCPKPSATLNCFLTATRLCRPLVDVSSFQLKYLVACEFFLLCLLYQGIFIVKSGARTIQMGKEKYEQTPHVVIFKMDFQRVGK